MNAAFHWPSERRIHAAEANQEEFCLTPGSRFAPEISWCRMQSCGKVPSSMNAVVNRLSYFSVGLSLLFATLMLISLPCAADERSEWREKMQSIVPRGYLCHFATNGIKVDGNL